MTTFLLQKRLKWTARIIGLAVCVFYYAFVLFELIPGFEHSEGYSTVLFLSLLTLCSVGYVASWQWQIPGALMQVLGGVGLFVFMFVKDEYFLAFVFGSPFVFTGSILIYSILIARWRAIEAEED